MVWISHRQAIRHVLIVYDKRVFVFHEERFQLPSPSQDKKCKMEIYCMVLHITSTRKGLGMLLLSGHYIAAAIYAVLGRSEYIFVQ